MLVAELLQLLVVVAEPNRRRGRHSAGIGSREFTAMSFAVHNIVISHR